MDIPRCTDCPEQLIADALARNARDILALHRRVKAQNAAAEIAILVLGTIKCRICRGTERDPQYECPCMRTDTPGLDPAAQAAIRALTPMPVAVGRLRDNQALCSEIARIIEDDTPETPDECAQRIADLFEAV